jgi:hypothetical protein
LSGLGLGERLAIEELLEQIGPEGMGVLGHSKMAVRFRCLLYYFAGSQADADCMIRRRAAEEGILTKVGNLSGDGDYGISPQLR